MTDGLVESSTKEPNQQSDADIAAEKLLPQSEVNKLVGGAKNNAYQKGYQQAVAELQATQPPTGTPSAPVQSNPTDLAGVKQIGAEDLSKAVQEEIQRLEQSRQEETQRAQQEAYAKQVITELTNKVNDAKTRYPDFDEVTSKIDFTTMPEVLELANVADNSGDVLYDLAKNPSKIATLRGLPPQVAVAELQRLSDSIKSNQSAAGSGNSPKEPLNHIQPSSVGRDNGTLGVKDYKRMFRG